MIPICALETVVRRRIELELSEQLASSCRDAFERAARYLGTDDVREATWQGCIKIAPSNLVARCLARMRRGILIAGVQLVDENWLATDDSRELLVSVLITPTTIELSASLVDPSPEERTALALKTG